MSKTNIKIATLILAAGSGTRFGQKIPKQYQNLAGKSVLEYSIDVFKNHPLISNIVIVIDAKHKDFLKKIDSSIPTTKGGGSRQESVKKGLESLKKYNPDFVLIHDSARPLVSVELITNICNEVVESNAVIPAIPITDTVKRKSGKMLKTESRENLYSVETPQAFNFELIYNLHDKYKDENFTDDAALCEKDNIPVEIINGEKSNIKITNSEDLLIAEHHILTKYNDIRTGQGFDVHRFSTPTDKKQDLIICGVTIPHDKILEGHSDADVALHSLTDALLGTICEGDIGEHFSPKDSFWENADSSIFLKHAVKLLKKHNGIIAHIDITIIAQEPKIAPYRNFMRENISKIINLPLNRISIKATTTEGLGFTGRGEGIAAQSIVTARFNFES